MQERGQYRTIVKRPAHHLHQVVTVVQVHGIPEEETVVDRSVQLPDHQLDLQIVHQDHHDS